MAIRHYIVGNWKMNGTRALAADFATKIAAGMKSRGDESACIICPPTSLLPVMAPFAEGCFALGGQDCHAAPSGAHTGDISAEMLKDVGCRYVILGHSERRSHHGESDALVSAKAAAALRAGLTPIYCVGETLDIRERGEAEIFVAGQLSASLAQGGEDPVLIIAYEPVWAIGTGRVAGISDIKRMHRVLRDHVIETVGWNDPETLYILYGGSVKAENAAEILDLPEVGGVLVGGASLNEAQFSAILSAAR